MHQANLLDRSGDGDEPMLSESDWEDGHERVKEKLARTNKAGSSMQRKRPRYGSARHRLVQSGPSTLSHPQPSRASKNQQQTGSARSPTESVVGALDEKESMRKFGDIYDAVAGLVGSQGFLPTHPRYTESRDQPVSTSVPVPPEEVLFRQKGAPIRYEDDIEGDPYSWTRHLDPNVKLPDSDLLHAIHGHASSFYAHMPDGHLSFRSLDGTALVAMGILIEEQLRDKLGESGDLALTESSANDQGHVGMLSEGIRRVRRSASLDSRGPPVTSQSGHSRTRTSSRASSDVLSPARRGPSISPSQASPSDAESPETSSEGY